MNRPKLFLGLGLLAVLAGLVFFPWPHAANQPLPGLQIVRQREEEGKPVVYFQVKMADPRRIQITSVGRVVGNTVDSPVVWTPDGGVREVQNFWAPSQVWPMGDPRKGRKAFGVLAPTNAAVWKLRVTAYMEQPTFWQRFRRMPQAWSSLRARGGPFWKTAWDTWNAFYGDGSQVLESGPITNTFRQMR